MKTLISISLAITGAFLFSYAVFAFDPPTEDPPEGNVSAPINVGPDAQIKSGGLWVNSLGVNGDITDALGGVIFDSSTRKIRESSLPFSKGDIVDPGDRSLISGRSGYTTQYFKLGNLGISGTNASKVQCGLTFGPNNQITGSYCEDSSASCSGGQCVVPRKRVFVTSGQPKGDFGGPGTADSNCQGEANSAGLGGTWTAWLSYKVVSTEFHAKDRITDSPNGWERVDGVKIADNMADLLDGNIDAPINLLANGSTPSGQFVWTGTNWDGTYDHSTSLDRKRSCYNSNKSWNSRSSLNTGRVGSWSESLAGWSAANRSACHVGRAFYCFEN